jgi:hypothetical protein
MYENEKVKSCLEFPNLQDDINSIPYWTYIKISTDISLVMHCKSKSMLITQNYYWCSSRTISQEPSGRCRRW